MESSNGIKAWQWVVTVVVIIILVIIGVFVFGSKNTEVTTDNPGTITSPDTTVGINRIVMSDQYPGNIVYLSSVQFENGGWVVIHNDNAGKLGSIIGQSYFEKGINPGRITLTQPTVEGGTYYAVLYKDDGDKKFDATKDLPLKDKAGSVIMKIFRAAASVGAEIKG